MVNMPKKTKYRMRAHINPLGNVNFPFPKTPTWVDWSIHFPQAYGIPDNNGDKKNNNTTKFPITYDKDLKDTPLFQFATLEEMERKQVKILDIGCGYGGLLYSLAKLEQFDSKLMLGMEI